MNSHHFHVFHEIHWFPWNDHKIIKSVDFSVLVRNSMNYPKRACGYLWIRLYIASPTASAAKGTTFGHEKHKFHHFYGISWKCGIHDFMEKCEIHVKSTRKQPSAPAAENSSNSYAFYMVRRPFGCFWSQNCGIHYISPIVAEFHPFWWNGVKFGGFWCLGDGNLAFTRSSMKSKSILGLFRCFSRPDTFH